MNDTAPWREIFDGGSPEAEAQIFATYADDMRAIQAKIAAVRAAPPDRTLHAKILAGVTDARLIVSSDLPAPFAVGYFQPGADLPVTLRLSNASPLHQPDSKADLRGAALKVHTDDGPHDLLMTSYPVSHARNAGQFVTVAKIAMGPKPLLLPRLLLALGVSETVRIIKNIKRGSVPSLSLARQAFWSRAPVLWGEAGPVRYMLFPAPDAPPPQGPQEAFDCLSQEFAARLRGDDVRYHLLLQPFVDEKRTPIEDGAVEWSPGVSPPVEVARLVVPQQDLTSPDGLAARATVDGLAFNPWNSPAPFRPLGNLNRARGVVYGASARGWQRPTGTQAG